MAKESVGMPSVIFTVLQIVLTKLSLLFSCGSRAQNKRAIFFKITTKLRPTLA
jgi:hypothetical protein